MEMMTGTWLDWLWLIPILVGTYAIWSVIYQMVFKTNKEGVKGK